MAITLSVAAARMLAAAANVATQMGSGTTQAEVESIAQLLSLCAQRPAESTQLLKLGGTATAGVTPG